jgi:death-on-curing protein
VDGNKRTAVVALETPLNPNGLDPVASDAECAVMMLRLAAGDLPEQGLAAWLRDR